MKAKSIKGKSPEEIQSALEKSMAEGFKPTLAIVFLSVRQDRKAICKLLDSNGIAIFGATTSGEFIDEVTEKGTVVMLLLDMNKEHFQIYLDENKILIKGRATGGNLEMQNLTTCCVALKER